MAHANVTIEDLNKIIPLNLQAGAASNNPAPWQPLILLGSVGIAKTQYLRTQLPIFIAQQYECSPEDVAVIIEKPARRDSAELAGVALPSKDEDGTLNTQFTKPPTLSTIEKAIADGAKHVVLLWDELAAAGASEQKVMADTLDPAEHSIGGRPLPTIETHGANVFTCATGNRAQDKAGSTRLLSINVNRAMTFNLEFSLPALSKYWSDKGLNPLMMDAAEALHPEGFFVEGVPTEDGAFNTPRQYEQSAGLLSAFMDSEEFDGTIPRHIEKALSGIIGIKAASQLTKFIGLVDQLPSVSDILTTPSECMVPDQTGFQLLAANKAMASMFGKEDAEAVLKYIVRLRPDLQVSLGTKLLTIATKRAWNITDPIGVQFIAKYHDLLPLAVNLEAK
jgi:hypothetical protein